MYCVGHAFVEKRKRIALREYKKLLKKTRNDRIFNGALDEEAERGFVGIPSRQVCVFIWRSKCFATPF